MEIFLFILIGLISCVFVRRVVGWCKNSPPTLFHVPLLGSLPFLGPTPHETLSRMRKEHGDVIGVYFGSTYVVVLNEYSIAKEIYSNPATANRPVGFFDNIPQFGFAAENGPIWSEQRKFSMQTTRDLGLGKQSWEDIVTDEVTSFVEYLRNTGGQPTRVEGALRESISANIIIFLIGRTLDKKTEDDKIQLSLEFGENVFKYIGPTHPYTIFPVLKTVMQAIKSSKFSKSVKILRKFSDFIKKEIMDRRMEGQNFLSVYLNELSRLRELKNKNHHFSEQMLEGNVVALFTGASDTTVAVMTFLLRFMAANRDVQCRVHSEVMEVLGKDRKARYEARQEIPYTCAVVMETLRASNVQSFSPTRVATEDLKVNGYTVPRGTELLVNIWALHNDTQHWDQPHKFNPERFLTDDGKRIKRSPPSYMPFSIGKRNCPGETVAWMEILAYFTEIVKNFEIRLPAGQKADFSTRAGLVNTLYPQHLCFEERKSS